MTGTIDGISARAATIPTDAPEADGTLTWNSTTIIIVRVAAGGHTGLGIELAESRLAELADSTR